MGGSKGWQDFVRGEEAREMADRAAVDDPGLGGAESNAEDPGPVPEEARPEAFGDLTVRLPRGHLEAMTVRAARMGMMPDDYVRYLVLLDLRRPVAAQAASAGAGKSVADRAPVEARVLEEMRIAPGVWFRAVNLGKLAGLEEAEAHDLLDRIAGSGACEADGAGRYRVLP